MKTKKIAEKRIIDIIPLAKIPPNKNQIYSYLSPVEVKKYNLVKVNFGGRKINGLVVNKKSYDQNNESTKYLKEIEGVFYAKSIITKEQEILFLWLSEYYWLGLSSIATKIIPKIPKKYKLPDDYSSEEKASGFKFKPSILFSYNLEEKNELLKEKIRKNLSEKKQTLWLVPEKSSLLPIIDFLKFEFGSENIIEVSGDVSDKNFFEIWNRIISGHSFIIVGTKQSVFLPFMKLGLIIVDEEHNPSHKQWEGGFRYDARKVSQKLAEIHKSQLLITSPCPRIATFSYYRQKKANIELTSRATIKEIIIANMSQELATGNYSPISQPVRTGLENAYKNNRQAILIVNRRGSSSFSMCRDCGFVPKCPRCLVSLSEYTNNKLRCLSCGYATDNLLGCPNCHSRRIKNFGIGTQKVAEEVKKILPEIKVGIYDSDLVKNQKTANKLFQLFDTRSLDAIISTSISTAWKSNDLELIAFINIDSTINSPEWNSKEKTFSVIKQATSLCPEKLILQSYNSNSNIFQEAFSGSYESFFKQENEDRKNFSYPPFSKIIKIITKNIDKQKSEYLAKKIYSKIRDNIEVESGFFLKDEIELTLPQPSRIFKLRDEYYWHFLIKIKKEIELNEVNRKILGNINENYLVDCEPEKVL